MLWGHGARTWIALVGCVAVLFYTATLVRSGPAARYAATNGYEDRYYLPEPVWLPLFSLGHREALADLLYMAALVYYGEEMTHGGALVHVRSYSRAIVALDPDFRAAYHWTGIATFYGTQGYSVEDGAAALAIMDEGCTRFPNDGRLAWETGALYAFELAHLYTDEADRDRARARGVEHLVRATQLGAAPPYAALANASLMMRVGRAEEAASHLEEMYATTSDPDMRNTLAERIADLRNGAFAAGFVEENRRFEDAWGRQMPYAPAALYDILAPIPPIDTTAVLRDGFGAHALDDEIDLEP